MFLLSEQELREIAKTNDKISREFSRLDIKPGYSQFNIKLCSDNRIYIDPNDVQNSILGSNIKLGVYHNSPVKSQGNQLITFNAGDTKGFDQGIEETTDRSRALLDYILTHNAHAYPTNDISLVEEIAEGLKDNDYSFMYIPSLFKSNIDDTSGLLLLSKSPFTDGLYVFPHVVPQGYEAWEPWNIELYHPIIIGQTTIKSKPALIGTYYISSYSLYGDRRKFVHSMLRSARDFADEKNIQEVYLGGDSNTFGVDVNVQLKNRFIARYIPMFLAHLFTTCMRYNAKNILNSRELVNLNKIATLFRYNMLPDTWQPTVIKKIIGIFGISFLLDIFFIKSETKVTSTVIPGPFHGEDHEAVQVTVSL